MSERPSFFAELQRRNVYKVAVACAVIAWLLIQIARAHRSTLQEKRGGGFFESPPASRRMGAHNFLAKLESQDVHASVESCHSVGKEDHGA